MEVNATVDIGKNLTSLVEKLAEQIGTTADKVFPWYVQQAHLEGTIFLSALGAVFVVCLVATIYGIRKGQWHQGSIENLAAVATVMGCGGLFICIVVGLAGGSDAATKAMNPQYHAMKMLTRDIGRLTAR